MEYDLKNSYLMNCSPAVGAIFRIQSETRVSASFPEVKLLKVSVDKIKIGNF